MKEFDLEKALAGEPFQCKRKKHKFYYLGDASKFGSELIFPIVLYNATTDETVNIAIEHFIDENYEMYEEPRPTVTLTLPCPLKAVMVGQKVFYLDLNKQHEQVCSFLFQTDSTYHFNLLKNGGIFSTKEDAQAWLDALKNARR
ncbi:pyruvate kinase [Pasteurella multocida]|uniref:pyruvate kinase n=1 Tax=Pasteurella multocida TaxID=747 RepID=UPI003CFA96FA